jgi:hypothetical protein
MTFQPATAFRILDQTLLRAAALLVPRPMRREWSKEWQSELWHVREACAPVHGIRWDAGWDASWDAEKEILSFCAGAFRDGLCLRKEDLRSRQQAHPKLLPTSRTANSASQCLLLLAALGIAAYCIAMLLPGTRAVVQPYPYREPGDIMLITGPGATAAPPTTLRADQFRAWKDRRQHLFTEFAFYQPILKSVTIAPRRYEELSIARSSRNLFTLLGLPIQLTRTSGDRNRSLPGSSLPGSSLPGLILTEETWHKYFNGDEHIAGKIVTVGLRRVQVVGMLPNQQWVLPGSVDAWMLEPDDEASAIPATAQGFVIGRLAASASHLPPSASWTMSAFATSGRAQDFSCVALTSRLPAPMGIFVFTVLLAFLALPATTSLPLGEYPQTHHEHSWYTTIRRWVFLASKLVLILPIVYYASLDLAHLSLSVDLITSQYIQIVASFCICLFSLRWSLRDQRQRCPVCLGKLTHPARVGQLSRNFLAWNGTELICVGGHGLLHVPDIPTSWFSTQRWLYLDPSWEVLFSVVRS